jgi:hypothetical protein
VLSAALSGLHLVRAACATSIVLLSIGCSSHQDAQGAPSVLPAAAGAALDRSKLEVVLASLQNDYATSNWSAVQDVVYDSHLTSTLLDAMKNWKKEGVRPLRFSLVYSKILDRYGALGTVSVASDPRAIAYYYIWIFDTTGPHAQVTGETAGISGATFLHATWRVSRTRHFVVYHSPYQLLGADREGLAALEYQRTTFMRAFGVSLPSVVSYYYYPQQQLMARLTEKTCGKFADNIGCATPFTHPPAIQASVWPTYHEPIHVYQRALEPQPHGDVANVAPLFIAEGMAVALEDRTLDPKLSDYCSDLKYVPLNYCAHIAITYVHPMDLLSDYGFSGAIPGYAYSLGGSFVGFLIERHGYRAFGRFYYQLAAQPKDRESDYDVASKAVYHQSIRALIHSWATTLCKSGCS